MMNPPPSRFLESQSRACADVVRYLLHQVLIVGRPADRVLAGHLRQHHEYGARDRRLLSGLVFAVFRWWGWERLLLPLPYREMPNSELAHGRTGGRENSNTESDERLPLYESDMARLLLAASILEGGELPDVAEIWAGQAGIPWSECRSLNDRNYDDALPCGQAIMKTFMKSWQVPELSWEMLVPGWSLAEIEAPGAPELIPWLQRRPPLWLRVQSEPPLGVLDELRQAGIQAAQHVRLDDALYVAEAGVNLYSLPAFRKGRFEVQDLASQLVGHVCEPCQGQRWWDACAGAGGKTLHLSALMRNKGTVVATDVREYKLDDLKKRARRAGIPNIQTRRWDGRPLRDKQASFDGVLVDSPCSCSGTWRRNPDARWSTTPEDVHELSTLQFKLLSSAASGVKPGGTLVYATCSLFKRENQGVVELFMAKCPEFTLCPFMHPLTGEPTNGMLQVWPWNGDCDAMFMARFKRGGV